MSSQQPKPEPVAFEMPSWSEVLEHCSKARVDVRAWQENDAKVRPVDIFTDEQIQALDKLNEKKHSYANKEKIETAKKPFGELLAEAFIDIYSGRFVFGVDFEFERTKLPVVMSWKARQTLTRDWRINLFQRGCQSYIYELITAKSVIAKYIHDIHIGRQPSRDKPKQDDYFADETYHKVRDYEYDVAATRRLPEFMPMMNEAFGECAGPDMFEYVMDVCKLYALFVFNLRWNGGNTERKPYYGEIGGRIIMHTESYVDFFLEAAECLLTHKTLSYEMRIEVERRAAIAFRDLDVDPDKFHSSMLLMRGCRLGRTPPEDYHALGGSWLQHPESYGMYDYTKEQETNARKWYIEYVRKKFGDAKAEQVTPVVSKITMYTKKPSPHEKYFVSGKYHNPATGYILGKKYKSEDAKRANHLIKGVGLKLIRNLNKKRRMK